MSKSRVLIVEDDPDGSRSVQAVLEDAGCEVVAAATAKNGVALFEESFFDVVLSDLMLPDEDGLFVLEQVRRREPDVPVMIMTAYGSVDSSVKALKSGAYDYITKPLDLDDLQSKVARAIETRNLRQQVSRLSASLQERYALDSMVAQSLPMQQVLQQIRAMASTDATVLIQGESGTGKELAARALHVEGRRAAAPFVAVNCGAFTESLLESELFGHEKGAFTGATRQHAGAFERAHGGTLFLDEVGDAPRAVQVKLLRVLEEREIIRVGGQEPIAVDVRVLSATNRELEAMVEAGEFRQDLLYRLKVVTLELPPLRKRRADIRSLTDRFIAQSCLAHGRHIEAVEPAFYERLEQEEWPGNIRQLKNIVEAAVVMTQAPKLTADLIQLAPVSPARDPDGWHVPEDMTLEQIERMVLEQTLRRYDGNRSLTAEKLGISRRTIQRKIQELDLPF
jgi:two-component system response regulator HydG